MAKRYKPLGERRERNKRAYNRNLDYRIIMIPKKGKGFRQIAIPSKDLVKFQRSHLPNLNSRLISQLKKHNIFDCIHGFMPYKNPCTAAIQHVGYDCTIIMDIKDFFDSCKRSQVEDVIGITEDRFYNPEGYLMQGFATSPVLANACLVPAIARLKKTFDEKLKDYALTVYADDIQLSINLQDEGFTQQNWCIKEIHKEIEYEGFVIKPSKTRIRYAKHGFRRILGVNVGPEGLVATRKTIRKMRAARHQRNYSSLGGLTTWSRCLIPLSQEERLAKQKAKNLDKAQDSVPQPVTAEQVYNFNE